ncbi:site-specific DNA-methyltransferase [Irregularibacter muris]|uniref:Site-specific DNA-methyltransferase n=1 Tax=Irregularibacter muris TaxID=1796619 RepID=A0AAE3HF28_9FIRM|nr:site-specific DNA-methyltransferase [Irregularibacter muris]MCR1899382.1 site-specific DNA-methyltransferase [Irregularibacter muris]
MIKDILNENEEITPNSKEITVLKEHFPSCFKNDGTFDIERFKGFLSDKITVTDEGYELKFLGKNYARLLASVDTTTVVVPNGEHNSKPENNNSENIYISGDNLDGLKHLLKSYSGKIKCIYIDPPYNTGTDGFVYNDNFNFTVDSLSEKLSMSEEQAERILDLTKRGSASHSAWLMFMYPRLALARDLLTDDGAIFISIDDNEQSNLKLICDDVFGEENFVATITNTNNPKGRSDDDFVATAHEYIIVYAKSIELLTWGGFEPTEKITRRYNKFDKDGNKYREIDLRKTGENDLREDRPNLFYYFYYNEKTGDFYPDYESYSKEGYVQIRPLRNDGREGNWRWELKTTQSRLSQLHPKFMPNRKIWGIMQMDYLEGRSLVKPTSSWTFKDVNSERGTEEFIKLGFDKRVFPKPKPIGTISRCVILGAEKDDIILDFFSGSATTAHAVMKLNAEDGGNRKFILVQLPEAVKEGSVAEKAGYKTIDQIGIDRIIKAANKIKDENPETVIDLGFKHFTLEEPTPNTLDKIEVFDPNENKLFADKTLLNEFGKPTILSTWLVRDGYGLTVEPEELDLSGYKGYFIDKHLYLIDTEIPNEAIEDIVVKYETEGSFNPENIVLFGYSFTWTEMEQLKINLKRLKDTEKNLNINFDVRY